MLPAITVELIAFIVSLLLQGTQEFILVTKCLSYLYYFYCNRAN